MLQVNNRVDNALGNCTKLHLIVGVPVWEVIQGHRWERVDKELLMQCHQISIHILTVHPNRETAQRGEKGRRGTTECE